MKGKKLLSTIAALAIAASSFAGLTVNAATNIYTAEWSGLTTESVTNNDVTVLGAGWEANVRNGSVTSEPGKVLVSSNNGTENTYLVYRAGSIADSANKAYKFTFNYSTNSASAGSTLGALTSDTFKNYDQMLHYGTAMSNYGISDGETHAVTIILDNVNDRIIGKVDDKEPVFEENATTVSGLVFRPLKAGAVTDTISDFKVYTLDLPTITVAPTSVELDMASDDTKTATVAATLSENTELTSAVSSDSEVATAAIDGTDITVTAVGTGEADITVTAAKTGEGADEFETTTATFKVTVENTAAATTSVTIKKVDESGKSIADDVTVEDLYVGDEYTVEANQKDNIEKDPYRYVYKSGADPITLDADAAKNVITLVFSTKEYAKEVTVQYKADDKVVFEEKFNLSNLFYGDEYTLETRAYVKDSEGVIYTSLENEYTEDIGSSNLSDTGLKRSTQLAKDSAWVINVKKAENAVFFSEGENPDGEGLLSGNWPSSAGSFIASNGCGGAASAVTEVYTVPKSGVYQIVMVCMAQARGTAIYKSAAIAEAAATIDDGTALAYMNQAKSSYNGQYTVKTVELAEGDKLAIRGFSANGIDNLDYILIRDVTKPAAISSVEVVDTEVVPATDTISDVEGNEASYAELAEGKTVTTIYVKVDNALKGNAPEVTVDIDGNEEVAVATHFTTADADGYFVYQIIADAAATVKSVKYIDATWTADAE